MNKRGRLLRRGTRMVLDHSLVLLPVLFLMFPIAAYVQYGPGRELYRTLAFMVPALVLVSYFMIRFHLQFQGAYKDNSHLIDRLQREGQRVRETVIDVSQTNAFINEMPVLKITIEYSYAHKVYRKTMARIVSYESLHVLSAGATRWAWVDKDNPRNVVLP